MGWVSVLNRVKKEDVFTFQTSALKTSVIPSVIEPAFERCWGLLQECM